MRQAQAAGETRTRFCQGIPPFARELYLARAGGLHARLSSAVACRGPATHLADLASPPTCLVTMDLPEDRPPLEHGWLQHWHWRHSALLLWAGWACAPCGREEDGAPACPAVPFGSWLTFPCRGLLLLLPDKYSPVMISSYLQYSHNLCQRHSLIF